MALEDRVAAYVGTANLPSGDELDDWLAEGAMKHVRFLLPQQQRQYATDKSVPDPGGLSLSDDVLLEVHKNGYPSLLFPATFKGRLGDTDSIFEATTQSPAHYVEAGTLFVLPGGGNALVIEIGPIDASADTTIDVLPPDLEGATVIYAALQLLNANLAAALDDISDTLNLPGSPTLTTYPSVPSITIPSTSVAATTIASLPAAPSYNAPSISLPTIPDITALDLTTANNTEISFPSAPTLPSPPTYSAPTKPSLSGNYSELDTAISDDDIELANTIISEIQTQLAEYQRDIEEALGQFNADIQNYQAEYGADLGKYQAEIQQYAEDVAREVQEFQANLQADYEGYTREAEALLQQFSAEIQDAANAFQAENASYQRESDKVLQQAQITLEEELKNADASLSQDIQQAQIDLQLYQAEVQTVTQENSNLLREYEIDTNAEVQRFTSVLQSNTQITEQKFKQIQALRAEYQSLLQPYLQGEAATGPGRAALGRG